MGQFFDSKEAREIISAATERARAIQPRSSLAQFWRRLTSKRAKCQSAVPSLYCTQWLTSSSSRIPRSCFNVNDALVMDEYLSEVYRRWYETGMWRSDPQDLTDRGLMTAVDIPILLEYILHLTDARTREFDRWKIDLAADTYAMVEQIKKGS